MLWIRIHRNILKQQRFWAKINIVTLFFHKEISIIFIIKAALWYYIHTNIKILSCRILFSNNVECSLFFNLKSIICEEIKLHNTKYIVPIYICKLSLFETTIFGFTLYFFICYTLKLSVASILKTFHEVLQLNNNLQSKTVLP